eukprot:122516_1
MDLINIPHSPIHPHMAYKVRVNLVIFWPMLLHTNGNRSCDMHFWIVAFGGNKTKWTNGSLFAELWTPAKITVEQEQKLYFCEIRDSEQSLDIGEAVCKAKNWIKQVFLHLTISGNYGLKMMENMDMDFNIGFEDQD